MFDVVEHEGQPCIVMQLIESTPLSVLLREHGPLTPRETARIGAQVGSALAAAHKMRIVHRDVKPGNILITEDGSAMMSDFGISHALGDTTITATGMIHGTPAFLAPEVARGQQSSFASDVFSLGSTRTRCWRAHRRSVRTECDRTAAQGRARGLRRPEARGGARATAAGNAVD